jgi:hypothetical protein
VGLPNLVNFTNVQVMVTGMPSVQKYLLIQPKRWSNPVVLGTNGTVVSVGGATSGSGPTMIAQVRSASSNPQSLDLTASTGTAVQEGVGARQRQVQIGKLNPSDRC